jgi:hypothetical protein
MQSVVMQSVIMQSVVMLSVVMLSVVMLSVVMLSVVMLSVVMLSVMAPIKAHHFVVIFCIISVDARIDSNLQTFDESNQYYI